MLWRKNYLRSLFRSALPIDKKLSLSRNLFINKNIYIFAAGPSLKNVDICLMEKELEDSAVICIKQSIDVAKNYCDLMIMNFCNFNKYNWSEINCPVFWTTFEDNHNSIIENRNIKCNSSFKVVNNKNGLDNSTAAKNSWQDFYKILDGHATWGPGLMYELAIPIALNLGVKHIYLVGWDIGTINNDTNDSFMNDHFYDSRNIELKTKITNLEINLVSKSTKDLYGWLCKKNIELSVVSDRSLVDNSIPRENKWLKYLK